MRRKTVAVLSARDYASDDELAPYPLKTLILETRDQVLETNSHQPVNVHRQRTGVHMLSRHKPNLLMPRLLRLETPHLNQNTVRIGRIHREGVARGRGTTQIPSPWSRNPFQNLALCLIKPMGRCCQSRHRNYTYSLPNMRLHKCALSTRN